MRRFAARIIRTSLARQSPRVIISATAGRAHREFIAAAPSRPPIARPASEVYLTRGPFPNVWAGFVCLRRDSGMCRGRVNAHRRQSAPSAMLNGKSVARRAGSEILCRAHGRNAARGFALTRKRSPAPSESASKSRPTPGTTFRPSQEFCGRAPCRFPQGLRASLAERPR